MKFEEFRDIHSPGLIALNLRFALVNCLSEEKKCGKESSIIETESTVFIVSIRDVNQGFGSLLRCSGRNATNFSCQSIFRGHSKR